MRRLANHLDFLAASDFFMFLLKMLGSLEVLIFDLGQRYLVQVPTFRKASLFLGTNADWEPFIEFLR